jgi:hypothetical protein
MPRCQRCNKYTFDGTRWKSYSLHPEFREKYLCASCIRALNNESKNKLIDEGTKNPQAAGYIKRCPNCLTEVSSYVETCPVCKFSLTSINRNSTSITGITPKHESKPYNDKSKMSKMHFFAIVFVLILVAAIFHPNGIVPAVVFLLLWAGLIAAFILFAIALPYIVGGAIAILAGGAIVSYILGYQATSVGIASLVLGIIVFLLLLSLLMFLYFMIPAVLGALAFYLFIVPQNLIVAIIAFIVIALITFKLLLPFMLGFTLCSIAGQFALLITTVGLSAESITALITGGSNDLGNILSNVLSKILFGSSASILIFVVSIIFGILAVVGHD